MFFFSPRRQSIYQSRPGRPLSGSAGCLLMLLAAGFFWGSGNVANKTVLDHIGPLTAVGLRCLIATMVILPFAVRECLRTASPPDRSWLRSALLVSLIFAAAAAVQQAAFQRTSVTNAGFLVNTCTILTPVFAWIALGQRPARRMLGAIAATFAGAFLMAGGTLTPGPLNIGDMLCLLSAAFYAAWMVAVGHHAVAGGRPFLTCLLQFALGAALLIGLACLAERPAAAPIRAAIPELVFLGVFATAGAFVLQTLAQKHVSPSSAAVVVSSESLFGAFGAYLLLGERTGILGLTGAALILTGILVAAGAVGHRSATPRTVPGEALPDEEFRPDNSDHRGPARLKSRAQAA
jgi:drug/metabolite transporter (DMT)-like permease